MSDKDLERKLKSQMYIFLTNKLCRSEQLDIAFPCFFCSSDDGCSVYK